MAAYLLGPYRWSASVKNGAELMALYKMHNKGPMPKTNRLNTRISDELKAKLKAKAEAEERSESYIVERALKRELGVGPLKLPAHND